jgi:hypothetical protein
MRKHTPIDPDTQLIAAAADVLGTRRSTGAVHAPLEGVVAARLRLLDFQPELSLSGLAVSRGGRSMGRRADGGQNGA